MMFATINIGGMALFSLFLPETKGRSLEEVRTPPSPSVTYMLIYRLFSSFPLLSADGHSLRSGDPGNPTRRYHQSRKRQVKNCEW